MEKFKEVDRLTKHLQEDLLGKVPVFFNQCVVIKEEEDPKHQMVTMSAFQTDQYSLSPYHKVVSKII